MQDYQANIFLQSLRGNQAVVAMAFLLLRRSLTIEDIEEATGIHNDTVRKAVKSLSSKGLLFPQRGEHGRVTWIPAGDTFFAEIAQSPKTSDSDKLVSSSSLLALQDSSNQEEQEEDAESENFGLCAVEDEPLDEGMIRANRAACDEVGIRNPKKNLIANLRHVTPALIKAHVRQAREQGCEVGTAIYRIQNDWAIAPKYLEEKKQVSVWCYKCNRTIYQCECGSEEE